MRVISGFARGRHLKTPKGLKIRPTSDRVKEALFNIIREQVPKSFFLDLFSGTGSIGIEALSRGAARAVLVEQHRKTTQLIKDNLALTGLTELAAVVEGRIPSCIGYLSRMNMQYDLIFMDPPYLKDLIKATLVEVVEYRLLAPGGQVIVENSKLEDLPLEVGNLQLIRQERYGDTCLSFYRDN